MHLLAARHRRVLSVAFLAALFGCDNASRPAAQLSIVLDTTHGRNATVLVRGFSTEELESLRKSGMMTRERWQELLRVEVEGAVAPMAGTYVAGDTALEFTPRFPLDRGRSYKISASPGALPKPREGPLGQAVFATLAIPQGDMTPRTRVAALYPTADTVPENLLRLYIEFTGPMSNTGALGFVKLLDDRGREVKQAFLPLEADFWNREHTRYTLFLDPGRVKQGIKPNEELGRPLRAGRRYAITIDSAWKDAEGRLLVGSVRREFVVGPPDEKAIDFKAWKVNAPAKGSNDALVVTFAEPLDRGLLMRSLGVETTKGEPILGSVTIDAGERAWRFVPSGRWAAGEYNLVVLTVLEDPQGNQLDKPFEVDLFDRVDKSAAADKKLIPFTVR